MDWHDKMDFLMFKRGYKHSPATDNNRLYKKTDTGYREIMLDDINVMHELDKYHRRTGIRNHIQWEELPNE